MLDDPDEEIYSFNFFANNFEIPSIRTHYGHSYLNVSALLEQPVHLVGVQHKVDEESEAYVHHFVLSGYYSDYTSDYIWEWAPGIFQTQH